MGDDEEGETEIGLDIHQFELRFLTQLLVERAERLIEEKHLRPLGKRSGKRHALPLPAGKLARLAFGEFRELDEAQHFLDPGDDVRLGQAILLQTESDVLFYRHVREKRIGLEHHVGGSLIGRNAGNILALQQDAALGRLLETSQHAHQRGLAATGGAEQREELTLVNIKRQIVDGDEITKTFGDVFKADEGHRIGIVPGAKFAFDRP